jgi:hypothetical protein
MLVLLALRYPLRLFLIYLDNVYLLDVSILTAVGFLHNDNGKSLSILDYPFLLRGMWESLYAYNDYFFLVGTSFSKIIILLNSITCNRSHYSFFLVKIVLFHSIVCLNGSVRNHYNRIKQIVFSVVSNNPWVDVPAKR